MWPPEMITVIELCEKVRIFLRRFFNSKIIIYLRRKCQFGRYLAYLLCSALHYLIDFINNEMR